MSLKNHQAKIQSYYLLQTIPECWRTAANQQRLIAALSVGDGDSLNQDAAKSLLKSICDQYSLLPDQPRFDGEAWESAQRGERRVPGGDSLLTYDLGSAASEADIARLTAAMAG